MALISSEHFCFVRDKAELVSRLRQRADRLTFITYARDPAALYASGIDEMVRGGDVFSKLPKPADFRYPMQSIRAYAPLLPEGGLVVRSFRSGDLVDGDIVPDFFHVLSELAGRRVTAEVPVERENESLPAAVTLWLLSCNALGPFDDDALARRSDLIDALREDEALKDLPKLRMTDPEIAKAIRLNNAETLNWLNAGPLAHSPLETAPADAEALAGPAIARKAAALAAFLRPRRSHEAGDEGSDAPQRAEPRLTGPFRLRPFRLRRSAPPAEAAATQPSPAHARARSRPSSAA